MQNLFEQHQIKPYGGNSRLPEGTIRVDTYLRFQTLVRKWASGKFDDTLVVIGSAGVGKSETILRLLNHTDHLYVKGQASKFGVYLKLSEHIDEPVILDDVDELLQNREVTGILKALLETRNPKIIQWTTGKTLAGETDLPAEIKTKSRTMILANELKVLSKNFAAVLDRSTIIWFAPNAQEVHNYVGSWFDLKKHKDVYDYVGKLIHLSPSPSCRYYYKAKSWKAAREPWKKMVNDLMQPTDSDRQAKVTLVAQLLANDAIKSEKRRVTIWCEQTGETPQAYYATKRAIQTAHGVVNHKAKAISAGMKKHHELKKLNGSKNRKGE